MMRFATERDCCIFILSPYLHTKAWFTATEMGRFCLELQCHTTRIFNIGPTSNWAGIKRNRICFNIRRPSINIQQGYSKYRKHSTWTHTKHLRWVYKVNVPQLFNFLKCQEIRICRLPGGTTRTNHSQYWRTHAASYSVSTKIFPAITD
jgi:hypothetical protein